MILGAHVSVAGGLSLAPERAVALGCEGMQIFSRNQRQWLAKPIAPQERVAYQRAFKQSALRNACIHASYLINLAAPDANNYRLSIATLTDELQRAEQLRIPYVVLHPGAHKGQGIAAGWQRAAEAVHAAFDRSHTVRVRLLLENTPGQGSWLGGKLEELAEALMLINLSKRTGICLDTCHLFAGGYSFSSATEYRALKRKISATVGLRNVRVIHLNDSAKPFASRVDRHAGIGKGYLGLKAFAPWINDPAWKNVLGILETPDGEKNYARELRLLKSLRTKARSRKLG